jgi:hypothetical protein
MSKRTRKHKPWIEMNTEELAQATREFDAPSPKMPGKPLDAATKARLARALAAPKRRRGRPVVGAGAERITTTVERDLLAEADKFARRQKMSRAELIALGLRLAIGKGRKRA